jgi:hypothetical protein
MQLPRMELADILAQTIGEARQYLACTPEDFKDCREEIEALISTMNEIRRKLDKIPQA